MGEFVKKLSRFFLIKILTIIILIMMIVAVLIPTTMKK